MLELFEEDTRRLVTLDATIDEVLRAIEYIRHQRKLQHEKYRRLFVASTNPPGRPRKNPVKEPAPTDEPKRGRGRPKKQVAPPAVPEFDLPPPAVPEIDILPPAVPEFDILPPAVPEFDLPPPTSDDL